LASGKSHRDWLKRKVGNASENASHAPLKKQNLAPGFEVNYFPTG
jgi:hypothetical protein